MTVIACNIGTPTAFHWNGKEELTGIFKYPIDGSIYLNKIAVQKDTIINQINHGGINKACYLFAKEQYPYWKQRYPHLEWNWGMFGENLTISGLDESVIRIGDIYRVGNALVQISQPREPCYKLGIRFDDQNILRQFIAHGHSGTYVRVLEEGAVIAGDEMKLVQQSDNSFTVKQFFNLLYDKEKNPELVQLALSNMAVPEYKKERLKKFLPS
tara:strand:+ start:1417 stop:2055 length:639 start_codon:yes stop_codon:yes gene_type:complete